MEFRLLGNRCLVLDFEKIEFTCDQETIAEMPWVQIFAYTKTVIEFSGMAQSKRLESMRRHERCENGIENYIENHIVGTLKDIAPSRFNRLRFFFVKF